MRTLFCMVWLASQFSASCEGTCPLLEEIGGEGEVKACLREELL